MNNILTRPEGRLAKAQIVQMLDAMCQAIEPTETQYNDAAERYKTIGEFLAEENSPLHSFQPFVYPQGSLRIRAAIRPAHGKVFDVDVCCEFKKIPHSDPKKVKQLLWERFHSSDRYCDMAVEKNRCVRIQYAGDFHMDVMPCVPGQPGWSKQAHVWVPDKKLDNWKPSHPVGFAAFVEKAAAKSPKQLIALSNRAEAKAANVEPFTAEQSFTKPALIRIIQILKRHRDQFFQDNHDMSPISVIITTLTTHSYERSVSQNTFDSVYDLMLEVVSGMSEFIKVNKQTAQFFVENPTHPDENFAEKWNENPELPKWFFVWHRKVTAEIKALAEQEMEGLDKIGTVLANSFGSVAANQAIRALSASVKESTATGKTAVTAAGLVVPASFGIQTASKNPAHNFHGS
jgi:hypothetical protein